MKQEILNDINEYIYNNKSMKDRDIIHNLYLHFIYKFGNRDNFLNSFNKI